MDGENSNSENNLGVMIGPSNYSYIGAAINEKAWGSTTSDTLIPGCSTALARPTNYQAEGIIKRLKDR